jgi:hypothetical protein
MNFNRVALLRGLAVSGIAVSSVCAPANASILVDYSPVRTGAGLAVNDYIGASSANAPILVDYSPDTTGAIVAVNAFLNDLAFPQNVGSSFTLVNDAKITGGSIFSQNGRNGSVGDSVLFAIFPDNSGSPSTTPAIYLTTTLDTVDTSLTTTQPDVLNLHASITPTFLPAGTYWFTMPTITVPGSQTTGFFGDNTFYYGQNTIGTLTFPFNQGGKGFFTIEGTESVPEPSFVLGLLSLGTLGTGATLKRKLKNSGSGMLTKS